MAKKPINKLTLESALPAKTRDALRHLEIFARKKVEGMLHGAHFSRRKGVSTEFDHHKQYMPGDPIKHVDWKVSARHDCYYIKRYIEDTAMTVRLVVDSSASQNQSTSGLSTWDQAVRITASLAYLVIQQRDSVGMVMTDSSNTLWLPPSSTQLQLVRIMQSLVNTTASATDSLHASLKMILDRESRRGMVVVVSDLMFDPEAVRGEVRKLQAHGHEVLIFQVLDRTVEEFPFRRWVHFESLEQMGKQYRLDTVPLKRFYLEEFREFMEGWRTWAKKHDVHFISLHGDDSVETALSSYLTLRAGGKGTA